MSYLYLIGAGGHGKVVADTAAAMGYQNIEFLDSAWPHRMVNGIWKVVGKPEASYSPLFCSIGNNKIRKEYFTEMNLISSPVLIHPLAIKSPSVVIGNGGLIVAGVVINADVKIGCGAIINTSCSIDHDCIVGDFVHISPGVRLAGNVNVGDGCWIGIGAVVKEGVKIGKNVIIAAGAVVLNDIDDGVSVAGVPAQTITPRAL